ncbi:MAG TPA: hypothetical protein VI757_01530 [Bacteroidia bacterium]|nr:hypothetical protein [Bacteroidia bacterium]
MTIEATTLQIVATIVLIVRKIATVLATIAFVLTNIPFVLMKTGAFSTNIGAQEGKLAKIVVGMTKP